MFNTLLFITALVLVMWILIFQLLVPLIQGQPFFPILRAKKLRELEEEIASARQDQKANDLRVTLANMTPAANNQISDSNGESK